MSRQAFISGADISEFEQKRSSLENILQYNEIAGRANAAIINFSKPAIAVIQGYCNVRRDGNAQDKTTYSGERA
jgi:enoyl-CoA hydratase/carnithine racemase